VQITAHLVERLGGGNNYRAGSGFAKLNFDVDLPGTPVLLGWPSLQCRRQSGRVYNSCQPRLRQLGSRSRQENALRTAASVVAHFERGGPLPFDLGSEWDLDRATPSGRHTVAAVVGLREIPRVFAFKRDLINRERSLAQVGERYRCR